MIKINTYLSPKRVQIIDAANKNNALLQTLELFRDCPDIINYDQFCLDIFNREALLPTGIGLGIGVPHVKNKNIREPVAALSILKTPVDYGSMDGKKVDIIILVGMPQGSEKLYLQYLSKISIKLSSEENRRMLTDSKDVNELIMMLQTL